MSKMTERKLYQKLDNSPMFKLSLSSKELFHSNFLEYLSVINQDSFKDMITKMAGLNNFSWPEVWRVKREYNNFDLCVVAYDQYEDNSDERINDDEDFRLLFVLENKVKSIPYKYQLDKYFREATELNKKYWKRRAQESIKDSKVCVKNGNWFRCTNTKTESDSVNTNVITERVQSNKKTEYYEDYIKQMSKTGIHFILLSLAEAFPDKDNINQGFWTLFYYKQLPALIRESFNLSSNCTNTGIMYVVEDYCQFVETLSELAKEWEGEYKDYQKPFLYFKKDQKNKRLYNEHYKYAHLYRIHDLYQKLKFSYLCTNLYQDVQGLLQNTNWKIFPSNEGGLFKEKNQNFKPNENYICVNYTYLHGEPLLEVNIHSKNNASYELYYAIQVQGDEYERGIQVKALRKNKITIPITANEVWEKIKTGKINLINDWMDTSKDYCKYDMSDGTFLYQWEKIGGNETTEWILTRMKDDLNRVLNSFSNN